MNVQPVFESVVQRVLRPQNPRLSDAEQLLSTRPYTDETRTELWELFAAEGFISLDAIDNPSRRFKGTVPCTCDVAKKNNPWGTAPWCKTCGTTALELVALPNSIPEILLFASNWSAVLTAEERAREYALAIGAQTVPVIVWEILEAEAAQRAYEGWPSTRQQWQEPCASILRDIDETGYLIARARPNHGVLLQMSPFGFNPKEKR